MAGLVLLAGCGSRQGVGASESWSGVAIEPDTDIAFVGTRDGRLLGLTLNVNSRGAVQPQQEAVFDTRERDEGDDSSRVGPAFYATPTIANGRVYVGSYQGFVYSLAAYDRQRPALDDVGSFEIDGDPLAKGISGSVVFDDGDIVVVATENTQRGRMYVLSAEDLDANARQDRIEKCRYPAENEDGVGRAWTTPLVVDRIAYFGDLEHQVHAVSIDTCEAVWDEPAELGGAVVSTPVAVDGTLYVGAFDRKLYSIDMQTGAVDGDLLSGGSWFWASPATDGELVYAPNLDGVLYTWDTVVDGPGWTYDQEGDTKPLLSKPAVVGSNIVLASDSGTVTLIDNAGRRIRRIASAEDKVRSDLTVMGDFVFSHSLEELVTAYAVVDDDLEEDWEFQIEGF